MNKSVSVVIPTLQKNVEFLNNLISSLDKDQAVKEIILIDNSAKGYEHNSEKLRVIVPQENIFVNPAWNLGVREAKEDIVALLNDDITIPEDFCSNVIEKMTPDMGIVGFDGDFVEVNEKIMPPPEKTTLELKKQNCRNEHFGIAMFFYKSEYDFIPEDIKIMYGDDWIFHKSWRKGRKNYKICGQKIYHFYSMSVASLKGNPIFKNDGIIYEKKMYNFFSQKIRIEQIHQGLFIKLFKLKITISQKL